MSMSYLKFLRFKYGPFYKMKILSSWCSQDKPEIDERVIPMLLKWVKDRSEFRFAESAWLLGKIRDRRAVEPLISYLLESTESTHDCLTAGRWEAAIAAIVKIGDRSSTEALAAIASRKSLSLSVRTLAAEGLCALGGERGIPLLVEVLDSEERDADVRDVHYWWRKDDAKGVWWKWDIEPEARQFIEQSRESKDPAVRAALQRHEAAENAKKEKRRQESIERERMLDKAEREGIPIIVECEYPRKLCRPIPGHPEIPVCSGYCTVNPKMSESRTVLVTTAETSGKTAWYCEYCDRVFCGNCTYVPGSFFHHCPDMDCWATHTKPLVPATVNHLRKREWVPIKLEGAGGSRAQLT